ncbi:MAG: aminomethyl-transferring glycine dehydrogenase subunit GcvPA [Actinomycetota bacterium]|nr:aminomethyl-transferring glycine dehydrogenase subunit GcvPA [Actinomycetota bacterium]
MSDFVPHTDAEIEAMLEFMGLASLDDLFAAVPEALRLAAHDGHDARRRYLHLPDGLSEPDVAAEMEHLAARNAFGADLVCFAGGGAYDHEVPATVRRVALRSEFVTAYTPYQPEVAQGVLQALFEYQTMLARLAGVEIANASLYDGASACVEGINLAVAATDQPVAWLSRGVNPNWREVIGTFAAGSGHTVVEVNLRAGVTRWPTLAIDETTPAGAGRPGAVVVQYPNYLGCLEDLAEARRVADLHGALLIVAFDPVAAALLRSPGSYGADVVVGEGQPFGTPLSFGGPYLGLFACRKEHVRRLPGRLVGETVDTEGRRAYVTTLRTREQDIRREKASSNVCTNQTLIAVCCAVQLAWLGTAGLRELALRCARGTRYAREALAGIEGVEPAAPAPVLREFAVRLPVPAELAVERMADEGFLAGIPLDGASLGEQYAGGLLVSVTERRTRDEIDAFAAALEKVIR